MSFLISSDAGWLAGAGAAAARRGVSRAIKSRIRAIRIWAPVGGGAHCTRFQDAPWGEMLRKRNKARAWAGLASSSSLISQTNYFQAGESTLSPGHVGLPMTILLVVTLPSVEPLTV